MSNVNFSCVFIKTITENNKMTVVSFECFDVVIVSSQRLCDTIKIYLRNLLICMGGYHYMIISFLKVLSLERHNHYSLTCIQPKCYNLFYMFVDRSHAHSYTRDFVVHMVNKNFHVSTGNKQTLNKYLYDNYLNKFT